MNAPAIDSSGAGLLARAEELLAVRDLESALDAFQRAQAMGADPDRCAGGKWTVYMLRGDFPAAWEESDTIRTHGADYPGCLWNGEDIIGRRVIVRCLHGLGDAVQFLRYAPQVNALAHSVIWEVPPALLEIAPYFCGVTNAITWGCDQLICADWNIQLEIMELPYLFRTSAAALPIATSYLHLPPASSPIDSRMGRRRDPRVGIIWVAGEWNFLRSIPLSLLGKLLETPGCEFWNLQGGTQRQISRELRKRVILRDAPFCNSGILDLAAVISHLDLVITVDTLAAHLAGALGIPAWVLLQHAADWRWMMNRSDSPWYPSLRLFRQPSPGDWTAVLRDVEAQLKTWLGSQKEARAA